mmetsp:Transcript_12292/g.37111  ORF Transcript_12292/g.37111 Transcript_12292/m.37111 type:complete len:382 (+) Transcript_12292:2476-3621(+)
MSVTARRASSLAASALRLSATVAAASTPSRAILARAATKAPSATSRSSLARSACDLTALTSSAEHPLVAASSRIADAISSASRLSPTCCSAESMSRAAIAAAALARLKAARAAHSAASATRRSAATLAAASATYLFVSSVSVRSASTNSRSACTSPSIVANLARAAAAASTSAAVTLSPPAASSASRRAAELDADDVLGGVDAEARRAQQKLHFDGVGQKRGRDDDGRRVLERDLRRERWPRQHGVAKALLRKSVLQSGRHELLRRQVQPFRGRAQRDVLPQVLPVLAQPVGAPLRRQRQDHQVAIALERIRDVRRRAYVRWQLAIRQMLRVPSRLVHRLHLLGVPRVQDHVRVPRRHVGHRSAERPRADHHHLLPRRHRR